MGETGVVGDSTEVESSIITDIVEAVAEREGIGVFELPPLQDSMNTEGLEDLFSDFGGASRQGIALEFDYCGYRLSVVDGNVQILD